MATVIGSSVRAHRGDEDPGTYLSLNANEGAGQVRFRYRLEDASPYSYVRGGASELAVQCAVWDILDDVGTPDTSPGSDDDPFDGSLHPGGVTPAKAMWNVLAGPIKSEIVVTVQEFWDGWFSPTNYAYHAEMQSTFGAWWIRYWGDANEPNNSRTDAAPITVNTWVAERTLFYSAAGTAPGSPDADYYKFNTVPGTSYTVQTRYPDGSPDAKTLVDPYLTVLNSAGSVVTSSDGGGDGRNAQVSFTAATNGPYYVKVGSVNSMRRYGTYEIQVTGEAAPSTDPPVATITSPADDATVTSAQLTVWGAASSDNTITEVKVNGVNASTSNGFATWSCVVTLQEGTNTITVSTRDDQDNYDPQAAQITVSLDTSAPAVTILSPAEGAACPASEVTVTGTASDLTGISSISVNGVAASTSNGYADWTATVTLPSGQQTLTVVAEDSLGHQDSNAATRTVFVDVSAPSAEITSPAAGAVLTSSRVTVTGTAADYGTISFVKVNGVDATTSDGYAHWSAQLTLADGDHTLVVSTRDGFGHESADAASIAINVDTAPPVVTILTPADGSVLTSTQVTMTGTASDAHAIIRMSAGADEVQSSDGYATWTAQLKNLQEGANRIVVSAKDEYDNLDTHAATLSVTVDSLPPVVTITSPADGEVLTTNEVTVVGTTADASAVSAITVNGVQAATSDGYAHWSAALALDEGENPIVVSTRDEHGNEAAEAARFTVVVDTQPPSVVVAQPQPGATLPGTQVAVTGTATDARAVAWIKVNGVSASSGDGFANWVAVITLQEGANRTITVDAADTSGNVTYAVAQFDVNIDPNLDSDGDRMPDAWELLYGLNPNDPSDADADPDNDGFTNLEEYQLGTRPDSADSEGPSASAVAAVPNSVRANLDGFLALTAVVSDLASGASPVAGAEYFVDTDPGAGAATPMAPADGQFNSPLEDVCASLDTSAWTEEGTTHTIYVRGRDAAGNWGRTAEIQVDVVDGIAPGPVQNLRVLADSGSQERFPLVVERFSSHQEGVHPSAAALDGQSSTWWATEPVADATQRQYIILDLGADEMIGRIVLTPRAESQAFFPRTFKVKLATGSDFAAAPDKVNDPFWRTVVAEADFAVEGPQGIEWTVANRTGRYVMIDIKAMHVDAETGLARSEIAEMEVWPADETTHILTVAWTASGDDGASGVASEYDIRYSTSAITESNFAAAVPVQNRPAPQPSGTEQHCSLENLIPDTTYYVGVKVADEAMNTSTLAVTSGATTALPAQGIAVIEPADESTIVLGAGIPTYRWESPIYTGFSIQFSMEATFPGRGTRVFHVGSGTQFTPGTRDWLALRKLAGQSGGTLYWRVRGSAGTLRGYSPTYHQFTLDGGVVTPTLPADGAVCSPLSPLGFSWTSDNEAIVQFQLEICTDGAFSVRGRDRLLKFPRKPIAQLAYTLSANEWLKLKKNLRGRPPVFYWRVKGFDADRAFIVVSAVRSFRLDLGTLAATTPEGDISALARPSFAWSYDGDALKEFRVQISLDAAFSAENRRSQMTAPSKWAAAEVHELTRSEWFRYLGIARAAMEAPEPQRIYWRVVGRDEARVLTLASEPKTLVLHADQIIANAPAPSAQLDAAELPTFRWTMERGGNAVFALQFCAAADFVKTRTTRVLTIGGYRINETFRTLTQNEWDRVKRYCTGADSRIYWRILGKDPRGYFRLESAPSDFTVVAAQ